MGNLRGFGSVPRRSRCAGRIGSHRIRAPAEPRFSPPRHFCPGRAANWFLCSITCCVFRNQAAILSSVLFAGFDGCQRPRLQCRLSRCGRSGMKRIVWPLPSRRRTSALSRNAGPREESSCLFFGLGSTSVTRGDFNLLTFRTVCLKLAQVLTLRVPQSYITKCLEKGGCHDKLP